MLAYMSVALNPRKRLQVWPVLMGLALWVAPSGPSSANCLGKDSDQPALTGQTIDTEELDQLIQRAEQAMRVGYRDQARSLLEAATRRARQLEDARREAIGLGALGHAYLVDNRAFKASQCIREGLAVARETGDEPLLSSAYLNLANYQATIGGDRQTAELNFIRAINAAERALRKDLAVRARLNLSQVELKRSLDERLAVDDKVIDNLDLVERDILTLPDDLAKVHLLLAVGQRWSDAFAATPSRDQFAARAYQAIDAALEGARLHERKDFEASGLGALGQLYEKAGRSDEALDLYRQAETLFRFSETPNNAYPWSWHMAKLLVEKGDRREAIRAYQQASEMTKAIRRSTANVQGHRDFAPTVLDDTQTLLSEYLELLFDSQTDDASRADLKAIRDLVEQQREVEVQTFFQDDCIADLRSRIREVDQNVGTRTALIYPIELKQEWIMLVQIGDLLWSERLAVSPESLDEIAGNFRDALQDNETDPDGYFDLSKELYRLLIEPIRSRLEDSETETLVVVPSGPLRSIPFAALHDGADFLVRNYAIATVPGLSLLDSQPLDKSPLRALIGGLTTAADDYADLPNVPLEIETVRSSIPNGTTLEGADFVTARLKRTLDEDPYTVVHVASHAKLGASAADSFIVTHGGNKLGLDDLEDLLKSSNYREQPVQLLTLSACETAAGVDQDRSALGLAGIAIKSGARSALGTLWPVFDRSSPILMDTFYDALGSGEEAMNKAIALQRAQIALLDNGEFKHPVYWAPYLLIGSWN